MSPKLLHLEPTDVCNLACPMCAREFDHEFQKDNSHHLSLDQIKGILSKEQIRKLDKMFMCGAYGDPAAGKHTMEIYRYFQSVNPFMTLGMNTSGSLRTTDWWAELAGILKYAKNYAVFSIDGLEDTNHIYRVNSNWDKIIQNVQAFIAAGGNAHWDMLVFKHNEHQVDTCEQLARDLGFKWFRAKVSQRPVQSSPAYPAFKDMSETQLSSKTDHIEYPVHWDKLEFVPGKIDCQSIKNQMIYIDAQGRISPCSWLGGRQSNFITDVEQVRHTWDTNNPDVVCASACTIRDNTTNFKSQWRHEVKL